MRRRLLLTVVLLALALPMSARGAQFFGSRGGQPLNSPIVGMAATSTGGGYWLVAADGGIFTYGDAQFFGSRGGQPLNSPIVGMAATPDNGGYWLVAGDGGIFGYGNAGFFGSRGGQPLNSPIVGMAATSTGQGYWLVAADGGIFSYGDAAFFGATGHLTLNAPIVGMAARPQDDGYWLVASDGGIFAFGQAPFLGSRGGQPLARPIIAIAATAAGDGYWLAASDGGIFSYNAPFHGSTGGKPLNEPIVGMAPDRPGVGYWLVARDGGIFAFPTAAPTLSVGTVVSGLSVPWDLAFTPDGTLLFTERGGRLSAVVNGTAQTLATVSDVYAASESGLMGMVVDPGFATNRRVFMCQSFRSGATPVDVRVYAWTIGVGYATATRAPTPIVENIPVGSGRHNGCRLRFGADGMLWIGTGDAAIGTTPQDLNSLGGKVLRVVPATGAAAPGNPNGSRVYEYGHRNVQGLALRPGTSQMFAVEHGTDRDDEINLLRAGGNGGWDPGPAYDDSRPMTDLAKFPDANQAVWSSGHPTIATSGATFVTGAQWKSYDGAMVVACLKTRQLRAYSFDANGAVVSEEAAFVGSDRLRSPVQGPDGRLYVTTSNGTNDKILVFTPT